MKRILVFIPLLILGCQAPNPGALPRLGDHFNVPENTTQVMISSSRTCASRYIRIDEVVYQVAVDYNLKVTYISTEDSKFHTTEGIGLESTLSEVIKAGGTAVAYEKDWAHYSKLPSGWCAVFYAPQPDIFRAPTPTSKVSLFFKRK